MEALTCARSRASAGMAPATGGVGVPGEWVGLAVGWAPVGPVLADPPAPDGVDPHAVARTATTASVAATSTGRDGLGITAPSLRAGLPVSRRHGPAAGSPAEGSAAGQRRT